MSEAFEKWFRTTMLPAECDDERVMVGMRLCWNAAIESVEAIPLRTMFDEGYARGYRDRVIEEDDRDADAKGQDLYGRGA